MTREICKLIFKTDKKNVSKITFSRNSKEVYFQWMILINLQQIIWFNFIWCSISKKVSKEFITKF